MLFTTFVTIIIYFNKNYLNLTVPSQIIIKNKKKMLYYQ